MESKKSNFGKIIIGFIALVVVVVGMLFAFFMLKPKAVEGSKSIVIEVVHKDGTSKEFKHHTNQEYLRGALEELEIVSGKESTYGLWVETVDGETADEGNQEWWYFSKSQEMVTTVVDETTIADGDHFEITLTVGYDEYEE